MSFYSPQTPSNLDNLNHNSPQPISPSGANLSFVSVNQSEDMTKSKGSTSVESSITMEPTDQVIVIGNKNEEGENTAQPNQEKPTTQVEEEEEKHKIQINDWEVNRLEKKKWYLGIQRQRFPNNYISTTKVCCISKLYFSPFLV